MSYAPHTLSSSLHMPFEKRMFLENIINAHEARNAGRNYNPNILFECADMETASFLDGNDDKEEVIYYFFGASREYLGSTASDMSAKSTIVMEDIELIVKNSKAATKALNIFALAKNIESAKIHVLNSDGEISKPRFIYSFENVKVSAIYDLGDGNYSYIQLKTTRVNKEHTLRDQAAAEQGTVAATVDLTKGASE